LTLNSPQMALQLNAQQLTSMNARPPFTVQWLSPDREAEWDAFVGRHELGLVYNLSSWKRTLEDAFPHISGRFLALRENTSGKIVAGLPVYRVKSWLLGNRIVSVPFASFCNPLVSDDSQLNLLLPEVVEEYQRNRSDRLEIRMTEATRQLSHPLLSRTARFKHHFLRLEKDPDELFASLAKTSICQKVIKARKAGVVVEEVGDEKSLKVCHAILVKLRHRLCLPAIPYAFFEAMRRHLWPEHLKIFLALQEGKPVACHLVLKYKDLWTSEYSASTSDALHGVNQLLYWETIRRAIAGGAKLFSFGRTSVSNLGLLSYKRRWSTSEEDLTEYVLLRAGAPDRAPGGFAELIGPQAREWFKVLLRNSPVTLNRIIGGYCYRHMG
jgi:CelD/BcsL family acetyltransferase involved in cellulose biosynthesis